MKIVKRKTAESFMKVMTALSVITGANGLSAIAVPQNPQVDIDAAVDGYALFVTNVAHAEDAGTEIPGSFAPPIASDIPTSDIPTSDIPTSDIPTSDIPTSDIPTSDIPASDIPASNTPASDTPASDTPASNTPASNTPASEPAANPDTDELTEQQKAEIKAVTQTIANAQTVSLANMRLANNDLHKRMGDLRDSTADNGIWLRGYGGKGEVDNNLDYTMKSIQGGYDRAFELSKGKLHAGITYLHTSSNLSGDNVRSAGNGNLFGLYGTYMWGKGHYLDAIVKYGHFSSWFDAYDLTTRQSYSGKTGSNGLNASLEYGYRHNFKKEYYIEPQVEFNYSRMNGDEFTMSNGAVVDMGAATSLVGRLGFNLGRKTERGNIYLTCSLLREFKGDSSATITWNGNRFGSETSGSDTWLEYGIGFDFKTTASQNLYGELTRTAMADKISEKWRLNLGYRWMF